MPALPGRTVGAPLRWPAGATIASYAFAALAGICWASAAAKTADAAAASQEPPRAAPARPAAAPGLPHAFIQHKRVLPYPFRQVWPAAIRYLRVDRGYTVQDRDEDAGFILFEFALGDGSGGNTRTGQGSLEMFRTEDTSGRPSVQVQVSTSSGPTHLPHAIVEGLAAKVRAERGQPPPAPPKERNKKKPEEEPKEKPGQPPMMPPAEDPG